MDKIGCDENNGVDKNKINDGEGNEKGNKNREDDEKDPRIKKFKEDFSKKLLEGIIDHAAKVSFCVNRTLLLKFCVNRTLLLKDEKYTNALNKFINSIIIRDNEDDFLKIGIFDEKSDIVTSFNNMFSGEMCVIDYFHMLIRDDGNFFCTVSNYIKTDKIIDHAVSFYSKYIIRITRQM